MQRERGGYPYTLAKSKWAQGRGGSKNLSQGAYILNVIHFPLSNQHRSLPRGFPERGFNIKSKLSNIKTSSKVQLAQILSQRYPTFAGYRNCGKQKLDGTQSR